MNIIRSVFFRCFLGCGLLTLNFGCHDNSVNPTTTPGPSEPSSFTFSPIEIPKISFLLSLGWINPVGHTIPTDHVYFHFTTANTIVPPLPIIAPGGGLIEKILVVPVGGVNECKIWVRMNDKFSYYLDHVIPDASVKEGASITAGQALGTTGAGNSFDLGVTDYNVTLSFANNARYNGESLHTGKPFQYFVEPLKSQLYALVDREGTDKDGRIDLDVKGRLVGNWFLDGSTFYMDGPDGWDKELAFAYDSQHPSRILISIGGTIGLTGKWSIPSGVPSPADVSVSSGKVNYQLWSPFDPVRRGLMIIQMIDDLHVKVEVFPDLLADDATFGANARVYAR